MLFHKCPLSSYCVVVVLLFCHVICKSLHGQEKPVGVLYRVGLHVDLHTVREAMDIRRLAIDDEDYDFIYMILENLPPERLINTKSVNHCSREAYCLVKA